MAPPTAMTSPPTVQEGKTRHIDWKPLFAHYLKGNVRYFLSSSLDPTTSEWTQDDVVLRNTKPLAEWPHPRGAQNKLFIDPTIDSSQWKIGLYDMKDLFATYRLILGRAKRT